MEITMSTKMCKFVATELANALKRQIFPELTNPMLRTITHILHFLFSTHEIKYIVSWIDVVESVLARS